MAKIALRSLFKKFGFTFISSVHYNNLQMLLFQYAQDTSRNDLNFLHLFDSNNYEFIINNLSKSKSELRQDIFVLCETNRKIGGYFVEFGASNGVDGSNTFLLETEFSWSGILVEPAKLWKNDLIRNRPNSIVETLVVWSNSNSKLVFNQTSEATLSTIDAFSDEDLHKDSRKTVAKYEVGTITLSDLLRKNSAPKYIDYLSLDTEGSEYEILKAFSFNEYSFGVITVEHNYSSSRELVFSLLTENGYVRKFENISRHDDWYIKKV